MIKREKESPKTDSTSSGAERQQSTNLLSRKALWSRLAKGPEARARFVESTLGKHLAFQIRAMRDRVNWSQEQLAQKVGMNQNAISRLESPFYGKPTLTTLKRVATAFDVGLVVRFAPFGELVDWVSGTLRVERGLSPSSLSPLSFQEEPASPEKEQRSAAEFAYLERPPSVGTQLPLQLFPGNVVLLDRYKRAGKSEARMPVWASAASIKSERQNLGGRP